MKRAALMLSLMVIALATIASPKAFNLSKHRFKFSRTEFADTIPLVIDRYQQILIPVSIGGREHLFKLDTGSGFGSIYANGRIRPKAVMGEVSSVDGAGQMSSVRTVMLPPFRIGSVEVSEYVMTEAPASVLSTHFGHDAIIGFALFSQGLAAKIDLARKHIIITDRRDFFTSEAGETQKYELYHFAPYLTVSFAKGIKLKTLFDTGCGDFCLISRTDYEKHQKQLATSTSEQSRGSITIANHGAEPDGDVAFLHLDGMQWGKIQFGDIEARTHQGVTSIGRPLLALGSVVINSHRRTISFESAGTMRPVRVGNVLPDVYYLPHDGKVAVGLIRTSSPLFKAGLHRGDIILKVNGRDVDFRSYTSYPWVRGVRYTLQVRDVMGFMKEVQFIKR